MISRFVVQQATRYLDAGGVIAYPTEAVYGLGCDPDNEQAVTRLLELKQRPLSKGLILIAHELEQLSPYISELTDSQRKTLEATWPGPVTWVLPAAANVPQWLTGKHSAIATRVTAHPIAANLCKAFGHPLVSTSANPGGRLPARSILRLKQYFGDAIDFIVPGPLGGLRTPTQIRDLSSGHLLRPGDSTIQKP